MERLTDVHWKNLDPWECCGQDYYCIRGCHDKGGCTNGCIVPKLYVRLAAYEDTGLTPERCAEFAQADKEGRYIVMRDAEQAGVARLRELAEADKDGRCVVLPCKVGDTVWLARSAFRLAGEPIEAVVLCVANYGGKGLTYTARTVNGGLQRKFTSGQISKTVFFTREEAERAMEGRKDD